MIEIRKPTKNPIVVIRAASGHELSTYEKRKLANIEDNAQRNKVEVIKVNGQPLPIDPINKEVRLDLGDLAFKHEVTPEELSADELFIIKCELDTASAGRD